MLLSEWGCDAYNADTKQEDQQAQSDYVTALWHEIESTGTVTGHCLGGLLFMWRDAWCKSFTNEAGNEGHDPVINVAGDWPGAGYPDYTGVNNMNEEWWGIVGISASPEYRQLRQAYYSLQSLWKTAPLFQVSLHNRSDGSPASEITWDVPSLPCGWKAANQYLKIECTPTNNFWGIQIYTDNCSQVADPQFYIVDPSSFNPAGLVRTDTRDRTLKMCWRAANDELIEESALDIHEKLLPDERLQLYSQKDGEGYPCFIWMKDRKTPTIPTEKTEAFVDGESYSTLWNKEGMQHAEGTRSICASPNFVYIGANFKNATTPKTYKTSSLTVEFYNE